MRLVPQVPEAQKTALQCRTIEQALEAPTMRELIRSNGEAGFMLVSAAAAVIVNRSMEAFSPQRRMSVEGVAIFTEHLTERYPLESLADIALFMRGVTAGEYGDGETYGALDMQRLLVWFRQYLEQKAAAMERGQHVLEQQQDRHAAELIGSIPGLKTAVNEFVLTNKEQTELTKKRKRIADLTRGLPTMDLEQMREAWKLHPTAEERSLIQAEASRRGFMGDEAKEAQIEIDQQSAAA